MSMQSKNAAIVLVIIVIIGALFFFGTRDVDDMNSDQSSNIPDGSEAPDLEVTEAGEKIVLTREPNEDNVLVLYGKVNVPTPCHSVTAQVSYPLGNVVIDLLTETTGDTCAQVVTQVPFDVPLALGRDAEITLMLNGELLPIEVVDR